MFDMRGFKISVRGFHANDEDVPEGATWMIEGEDLASAPILALNDEGEVVACFVPDMPPKVVEKFRVAAVACRDALAAEQKAADSILAYVTDDLQN